MLWCSEADADSVYHYAYCMGISVAFPSRSNGLDYRALQSLGSTECVQRVNIKPLN